MRTMKATVGLAICYGVFAFGAAAQDVAAPAQDHHAMPQHDHAAMMAAQNDVNGLMDKLNKNLAAIGTEKKAGARKELLAAQGAMLKELQAKLQAQGGGMAMGGGMMMGKGMMAMGNEGMSKEGMGKDMDCCKGMAGMAAGNMKDMNCGAMMNMDMKNMDMKKMDMEPKK